MDESTTEVNESKNTYTGEYPELAQHFKDGVELTDEELDTIADISISVLRSILGYFDAADSPIDEYEGDEGELILDVTAPNLAVLIGRHGRTLESLQTLFSLVVSRKLGFRYPVAVDIEGYKRHLYFIPRQHMDKVDTFETFIEQLSDMNQNNNALSVNSFYIIDDAKQRDKMTEEFYSAVKKEIALYQEKADYLIQSGSRSPSVMERWVNKIATLEQKKQHYEEILRRELDGLDDEFETLRLLSQELSVRANGLRFRKAA